MPNPIIQQMNNNAINSQEMHRIKQIYNILSNSSNPQQIITNMLNNNPQFRQLNNIINENGGNAKEAFYNMCNKMGVNPEQILSQLR